MASSTCPKLSLSATYTSASNAPFTITHDLEAPPSGITNPTVPDKTKYLTDLRQATAAMQEQINKELTQRMEEDNAAVAAKNGKSTNGIDEAKEEENYGEEAQEEE
ncbi:hypothetical protein N0V82_006615 [Gnomoniopsis sp. IMI 355080]|nr:hypothetical protein N0V82_006615 [Gnomoniopsis sp. IMI 355080]